MIREHRWTLVLVAVLLGCSTSTPGHPTSPGVGSRTGPGLVTTPAAATGLYVAGEQGMHELDAAGNRARRLTRTPAFRPRLVEGGRAITFLSPGPSGTEIRRLELASLAETTLATLPRDLGAACGMGDNYQAVEHVQDDSSFVVSADGSAACLTVQDRNDNMVSVQLMVRVDLATGKVEQVVTMADLCESVEAPPHFMCAGPPVAAGYDTRGDAFPYRVRDGQLMRRDPGGGESARAQLGDLEAELSSESGRWQILAGSPDSGDYIYRKLILLDRRSGALYPMRAGAWPAAVQPAELARLIEAEDGTATVVGEDPVRALAGDRLLAGRLLVIPESKVVNIEGELAR